MNITKEILKRREMISSLVAREMKSRYRGSVLGFLWSVMTPLFMAVIYVFFLRILSPKGVPLEDIIIGVFAWQYTVQSINAGTDSITGNGNLVKKIIFPRIILPLSTTLASLVNFLISLGVLFAIVGAMLLMKGSFFPPMLAVLPLLIIYHTLFNFALGMLLGASNVYFRDTQHLLGVIITAWFFMSPAMYNLDLLEPFAAANPHLMDVYMLNPLAGILTAYRWMILPGEAFPMTLSTVIGLAWPLLLFIVAVAVFQKAQRNFADMM